MFWNVYVSTIIAFWLSMLAESSVSEMYNMQVCALIVNLNALTNPGWLMCPELVIT